MTPLDPSQDPQNIEGTSPSPLPADNRPPPAPGIQPFWGYQDLVFFLASVIPALLIAALAVRALTVTQSFGKPFQGLLAQLIWYALVFSVLFVLLRARYGQPFWRSLGWRFPFRGMALVLFSGPLLAIAIGYLGYILHTPDIQMPFRQMLDNRPTLILFAIFVVILGPLCEELAFRGFIMPLLIRSFGAAAGIVVTGLLFGCLHAPEYSWSWRHALLIAIAGTTFGWVRYKTGSTAAATLMHSAYNLTQFAAFLAQQ
jgi:membrane protease YdiL (CAAX protease family)